MLAVRQISVPRFTLRPDCRLPLRKTFGGSERKNNLFYTCCTLHYTESSEVQEDISLVRSLPTASEALTKGVLREGSLTPAAFSARTLKE